MSKVFTRLPAVPTNPLHMRGRIFDITQCTHAVNHPGIDRTNELYFSAVKDTSNFIISQSLELKKSFI